MYRDQYNAVAVYVDDSNGRRVIVEVGSPATRQITPSIPLSKAAARKLAYAILQHAEDIDE